MFKYIHLAGTFYLSKSKFQEQGLRNVESAVHQYKAYRWKGGMKWTGLSETKRCLLLGRKVMTNLDSILKSRDITLPTKVCLVKAMVFPVVMYGCESWTLKKSEHRRIDAFELWCWRRLLRVPWTARRSNQSILKQISPEYSWKDWCWSWNSNTLVSWYEELTHLKRPWCWEKLKAGGEGDNRGWDGWMASPTQWTWVWVNSGVGDGQGGLVCCSPWGCKVLDMTERLNFTELQQYTDKLQNCLHNQPCVDFLTSIPHG